MIKEYNPLEENAKARAAKRREELRKRKEDLAAAKASEQLNTAPLKDPRPWKGKPSSFFELRAYKRGTHKHLTEEQKEFLLIYYPDSVADPLSMMTFLQKQAQEAEEKER